VLLAACGGGSGGGPVSTPGPAPARAPGPTPTPGTPNPTSGANDDLLTPLVSETFSTFAARGSASYTTNGSPGSSSAGSATRSITYDAGANTYRVSTGGTEQTFGSGDIEPSLTNSQGTTYVRQSGSTTNALYLTKPGTSGALTYRWVGSGLWERNTQSSTTISGDVNAFVYGIRTPTSGVPMNGSANYSVDMIGVYATQVGVQSLYGTGNLSINFGSGAISGSGNATGINAVTGGTTGHSWSSTASLGSAGALAGTLSLGSVNAGMSGALYGPEAQEVGAAFGGSGGGNSLVGALTGRKGGGAPTPSPSPSPAPSPAPTPQPPTGPTMSSPLTGDTIFQTAGLGFVNGTGYVPRSLGDGPDLIYNYDDETIEVHLPDGNVVFFGTDGVGQDVPFESSKYYENQDSGGEGLEALSTSRLRIEGVPLSYLRHAAFFAHLPVPLGDSVVESFFFGLPTASMPASGTATYNSAINGSLSGNGNIYGLIFESSATFGVNFASGDITTLVHLIGTDSADDISTFDFGTVNGSGSITAGGPGFSGSFSTGSGWFEGAFFGPDAAEMGYEFFIDAPTFEANGYVWGVKD